MTDNQATSRPCSLVAALPEGVTCVGMMEFQGELFVALTCGVYVYRQGKLVSIEFYGETK